MKKKMFPRAFAGLLAVLLLAGCGQAAPGSQSGGAGTSEAPAAPSAAPVEMERVPVVDEQYADIFDGFEVVGSFHDGVAFAAKYLPYSPEYFFPEYYPLECGYLTLDGQFTPLYQVPNEWELLDATRFGHGAHSTGGEMFILGTTEGMSMTSGYHYQVDSAPRMDEQAMMDEAFRVGDNGWVPYFENDKWGYCDLIGAVKLAPAYDFVLPFIDGKALVCTYDDAYRWMLIDETGAQIVAFEEGPGYTEWDKAEFFAQRKAGGEYILTYGKSTGSLHLQDGTELAMEFGVSKFEENGGYALFYNSVYDPQGTKLYTAEDLVRAGGVQDGCTVYTDGTLYGIRGADGQVRCEARFSEICRLAPEGFYARENTNQVNLYDYDGNLIEETPACLRIVQSEDGFALYDGKGNILKQYSAAVDQSPEYSMNGSTFFTDEGFAYLRLSDGKLLTLRIAFEERPVEAGGSEENFPPEDLSLAWQTGRTATVKRGSLTSYSEGRLPIGVLDGLSGIERLLRKDDAECTEGLEWYETTDGQILVCDGEMNTVFTVPGEAAQRNNGQMVELNYLGDGLWSIGLNGKERGQAFYVFDRQGNLVFQDTQWEEWELMPKPGIANDGLFCFEGTAWNLCTAEGEAFDYDWTKGTNGLFLGLGVSDGGLVNSYFGYLNAQGEEVLGAQQLTEALAERLGWDPDACYLFLAPFEGEEAAVLINNDVTNENAMARIDRAGQVLGTELCGENGLHDFYQERSEQLRNEYPDFQVERPFTVTENKQGAGSEIITFAGRTVVPPEGMTFGSEVIQWDDLYAFVEVDAFTPNDRYILVDALGNTYPDCVWDDVYTSQDGAVWGVNKVVNEDTGMIERYEMTRLEITVS